MLTRMQRDTLVFIADYVSATGLSPTFDEIAGKLNLRSKSGVARLVDALEGRGFIRRLPNRARGIEVLKMPPGSVDLVAAERERCALLVEMAGSGQCALVEAAMAIKAGYSVEKFKSILNSVHAV